MPGRLFCRFENNLVFIPTGSASPDYFGGIRKGDNKWANSVVALRASTGEFVWASRLCIMICGTMTSLTTHAFHLEGRHSRCRDQYKNGPGLRSQRLTGAPLLPVTERPVPQSNIPGEQSSPTQPFSTISLVPEKIAPGDMWGKTPEDIKWWPGKDQSISLGRNFYPSRAFKAVSRFPETSWCQLG